MVFTVDQPSADIRLFPRLVYVARSPKPLTTPLPSGNLSLTMFQVEFGRPFTIAHVSAEWNDDEWLTYVAPQVWTETMGSPVFEPSQRVPRGSWHVPVCSEHVLTKDMVAALAARGTSH